jgi:hypothetical protein
MTLLQTLYARLEDAAYKVTDNFCYGCYKVVKGDYCPDCFSDDFMRHLDGVGVEYGTHWVIEHLIAEHCQPVDGEEQFAQMLDECCEELKVGCCTFSPSAVMKELDPVAFRCGVADYLADDDMFTEFGGEHYLLSDIEEMLNDIESE